MTTGFVSCGKTELKNARCQVKSVEIIRDSLKSMVVTINGEDKTVTLADARFQGGVSLQGDSIILDYIDGKDNTLRGLVVTVLPKKAHLFERKDTLITREDTDSIH